MQYQILILENYFPIYILNFCHAILLILDLSNYYITRGVTRLRRVKLNGYRILEANRSLGNGIPILSIFLKILSC